MLQDEILELLRDGQWHSAVDIQLINNHSISGLRQLNKLEHKGYEIEMRLKPGTSNHYLYRLIGEPKEYQAEPTGQLDFIGG